MKILIVQLGWSGHGVGGGDKHLVEAAEFWQKKHDVTLFLPQTGRHFIEKSFGPEPTGVNLWTAFEVLPLSFLGNLFTIILTYTQRLLLGSAQVLLSRRRFGIAVASSHFLYDLLPVVLAKLFRGTRAVVYVFHLIGDQKRASSLRSLISIFGERVSLWLVRRCFDLVMVDNLQVQERLGQRGVARSKIKVTPPGIGRPTFFKGLSKRYDLCFLGRLVRSKGVFDLVEVIKILGYELAAPRLAIMGAGDESSRLRKDFDRLGFSSSVTFLGEVGEETKYKVLQESKIFIFPSYEEGWGMALAEALSLGLPAVVYDLPVLKEVFGDGPVRVSVGDWKALAAEASKLLTDEDYYQRKSRDGQASVENYYLDKILPKELGIIESL